MGRVKKGFPPDFWSSLTGNLAIGQGPLGLFYLESISSHFFLLCRVFHLFVPVERIKISRSFLRESDPSTLLFPAVLVRRRSDDYFEHSKITYE